VNARWVPIYNVNLSEDVPGYMAAPGIALSYPWTHFICGHLGRLATRDDVAVHQSYIADIEASARDALAAVDPLPFYMHYGENAWAGVKAHLDTVTERAAAPIVAKYTGVLAAADIEGFTYTTTFQIMQSLRLDSGPSGPLPPRTERTRAAERRPGAGPARAALGCMAWRLTLFRCRDPCPRSSACAGPGITPCRTSTWTCRSGGRSRWSACPDRARHRWLSAHCTRR